jgi:hypothetical protein
LNEADDTHLESTKNPSTQRLRKWLMQAIR